MTIHPAPRAVFIVAGALRVPWFLVNLPCFLRFSSTMTNSPGRTLWALLLVFGFFLPETLFAQSSTDPSIAPLSFTGISVLMIFLAGLVMITLENKFKMDKYVPALMMLGAFVVIGWHGVFIEGEKGTDSFTALLGETKQGIFSLTAFLACMWMIVEILNERHVFVAINGWLLRKGCTPRQYFWATGLLCFVLSPFISSITTALIFGKSTKTISQDKRYVHAMLCNIIMASNAGIWFLGVSTTLMVLLERQVTLLDVLYLLPASLLGWMAGAWVLDRGYLKKRDLVNVLQSPNRFAPIKPGGIALSWLSLLAIVGAVWLNLQLRMDLEFALGFGFAVISLFIWFLKTRQVSIPLYVCLQKVEWATLMYYVGILAGVSALGYVGWLGYLQNAYEIHDPTLINIVIGIISCCVDNNVLEAAVLEAKPLMGVDQWSLNMLLIAIGGSLTVVGSAPGIIAMTIDRSYNFPAHSKFMPAIVTNFLCTILVWHLQYQILGK